MGILLGNLSVRELEEKHGFVLSDEDRQALESIRQSNAQKIEAEKFHIFDMPRTILCGSYDTAVKVHEILKKYKIKGQISISIDNKSN